MATMTQKIQPFFWFAKEAEEAARFYVSIFPDSKIDRITVMPTDSPAGPAGSVKVVEFTLCGQRFQAMAAGPLDEFNHAISMFVNCDDQSEVDRYWEAFLRGGAPEECGWVRDRFGLRWQIVPKQLADWMADKDQARAKRVADAMLKMQKLDLAALKKAYDGK